MEVLVQKSAESDYPGAAWLDSYRERVNTDPELAVIGRWFTVPFSATFGESRHVIRVERGRINEILSAPRFDVRATFGFRGPLELWQRYLSPNPPPLYHDIFAMVMRVPQFVLEGDTLVAMQNARALHRMMTIMRETGMPETGAPNA